MLKFYEKVTQRKEMLILNDKIKALVVEPYKEPYEVLLDNSLKSKQKIVGGLIEYCYLLDDDSVALICNDEGKILGLPFNREIGYDVICGNFIIIGDDGSGMDLSLTDEQITKYKERFGKESIRKTERVIENLFNKKNRER